MTSQKSPLVMSVPQKESLRGKPYFNPKFLYKSNVDLYDVGEMTSCAFVPLLCSSFSEGVATEENLTFNPS